MSTNLVCKTVWGLEHTNEDGTKEELYFTDSKLPVKIHDELMLGQTTWEEIKAAGVADFSKTYSAPRWA